MREYINNEEYVVFFVIVNAGMGSKVIKDAKELGVSGGTIFFGRGTAKNHFLELLGLDEIKKEIVMMISRGDIEDKIHDSLTAKYHLDKPNHGIAFSIPVASFLGCRSCAGTNNQESRGMNNMGYEAIFTIVDRGLAEVVVDAAVSAGAIGGTVVNARGSGIHESSTLFSMSVEPEKEIVMILIDKTKADNIINSIKTAIQIDEPGNGVMFVLDANKVSGLRNE